jgi:hypothetical protein
MFGKVLKPIYLDPIHIYFAKFTPTLRYNISTTLVQNPPTPSPLQFHRIFHNRYLFWWNM